MSDVLDARLTQILPRIATDEFLSAKGLGNELAIHIFDYPPEKELAVRGHISWLIDQIPKKRPGTKVMHVNLFDFLLDQLRARGHLDSAFALQRDKGNAALLKALRDTLQEEKLAKKFEAFAKPKERDVVLVSGVGSVFPILRAHTFLNNLHPVMGQTPLVMFYPGRYDGISLCLFGKTNLSVETNPRTGQKKRRYYRGFQLIPEEPKYAH